MTRQLLEVTDASLRYGGGPYVLRGVDLTLAAGERLGIVGQNGSGKSSLVKLLSGGATPEAGTRLAVQGTEVSLPTHPRTLFELGVGVVHQHLGVDPKLSVLENVRLGAYQGHLISRVHWREEARAVSADFARLGLHIDPRLPVGELPLDLHVVVALVRALRRVTSANGFGTLLLDEPTAMLERRSTDRLFSVVREVSREGNGVVLITHRLPEILENTDRVLVLRDGRVVRTLRTAQTSEGELIELMTGSSQGTTGTRRVPSSGLLEAPSEASLRVDRLSGLAVRDVSFSAARGEILGITGLPGEGYDQIPYLVTGVERAAGGTLHLDGKVFELRGMTPRRSRECGMVLIPADRARQALAMSMSACENYLQPRLHEVRRRGWLSQRRQVADARQGMEESLVNPAEPTLSSSALSGGNQQKLVIGKWLRTEPAVIIAHEPTQGVDVAAKRQIFERLRQEAATSGRIVIIVSVEYEDLAEICSRVLIVRDGELCATVTGDELTSHRLLELSLLS